MRHIKNVVRGSYVKALGSRALRDIILCAGEKLINQPDDVSEIGHHGN